MIHHVEMPYVEPGLDVRVGWESWCRTTLGSDASWFTTYAVRDERPLLVFHFFREDHAMMFRMAWCWS